MSLRQLHVSCLALAVGFALGGTVLAHVELSGGWGQRFHEDLPERGAGPEIGDYLGLPINDAARLRADSWDAGKWTMLERQCEPHPADYAPRGPASMRITSTVDPVSQDVISWHTTMMWMLPHRTIYMDGRPRPSPYVQHSWQGFSTGEWDGDMLKVTTTHLKEGWLRRNGVPRSDKATLIEYFIRHGEYLTLVTIVEGSGVSHRAVRAHVELGGRCGLSAEPVLVHPDGRDRAGSRRGTAQPTGGEPVSQRVRQQARPPGERRTRWRADDVSGLPHTTAHSGGQVMRRVVKWSRAMVVLMLTGPAASAIIDAQGDVTVLPAQGSVYVLVGPGGNSAVQIGSEGPLIVDTQPAAMSARVLDAVRGLSPRPIRHVVLTSGGEQQAGGAATISKAGRYIRVIDSIDPRGLDARASIIAHLNVLNRMSAGQTPSDAWPTDTYFTPEWSIFSNGEAVQLFHMTAATSDGDTIVFFRRSDVVCAGAIFDATGYPRFDPERGGSIAGIIEGLNRVLDLTVPGENQEGGTVVIPGRGRLSDETDVANYRDMVTIIRDRVRAMVGKGLSLEQVKRARPTMDYDGLFESRSDWTSDMFIDAIYRDLRGAKP